MTVNDADFGKLAMSHSKGVKYSNYDDVIWCQAKANYSTLYYTDKTKLVVSKSLKNMELILSISAINHVPIYVFECIPFFWEYHPKVTIFIIIFDFL